MTTRWILTVVICAFSITTTRQGKAQSIICRVTKLNGFEREGDVGRMVVGPPTSDRSKLSIYVTVAQGQLYVQSNYVTPGAESPAKLLLDKVYPLEVIVLNILATDNGEVTQAQLQGAIKEARFYIDRFKLDQSPFSELNVSGAQHITWDPSPKTRPNRGEHKFNTTSALSQPGVSPILSPLSGSTERSSDTPKSISEGVVAILWHSIFGQSVLIILGIAAAILAVWTTFPDSIKERTLNQIMRTPPASKNESPDRES